MSGQLRSASGELWRKTLKSDEEINIRKLFLEDIKCTECLAIVHWCINQCQSHLENYQLLMHDACSTYHQNTLVPSAVGPCEYRF